jgi:Holliday junction resolvase
MSNNKIENSAIAWLNEKLTTEGWTVMRSYRVGYDLVIQKGEDVRYVEVKSTGKASLGQRWLEPMEFKALNEWKERYFVYAITHALSQPELVIFDHESLMTRKRKEVVHYYFDFSKT